MSNPNKSEKKYHDDLCRIVGCICCRINGGFNDHVSIHHIDGRTKPGAHMKVLPLCGFHHQHGTEDDPSVHPWKARFEQRYGTQAQLQGVCEAILDYHNSP